MIPEFDVGARKAIRRLVADKLASGVPSLVLAGTDVDPDGDGRIESLGPLASLADLRRPSALVSTNTTISASEEVVGVDTGGGAVTVTLASSIVSKGRVVKVTDRGGSAGTNAITVATEGTESIDGGTSASISTNYGQIRLWSDGTNWYTV